MHPLDPTSSFIERCQHARSVEALRAAFRAAIEPLGFQHFACCSHEDPMSPDAILIHNYPPEWVGLFSQAELYRIDPVLRHADSAAGPFFWSDPEFYAGLDGEQKEILAAARTYGLAGGYTSPIPLSRMPGMLRASCSFVPDTGPICGRSYVIARSLAMYLYAAASRMRMPELQNADAPFELTACERAVLELAAEGKSDWVISQLLGVSKGTVHKCIERAKRRMGVHERAQAVIHALMAQQISFGGVVRVEPKPFRRLR